VSDTHSAFISKFLVESRRNLDQLERDLATLEKGLSHPSTFSSALRALHTIRGNGAFFGFSKLEALTEAGESLLGRLREGDLRLNGEITRALRALADAVGEVLSRIETQRCEGDGEYSTLINTLTRLQRRKPVSVGPVDSDAPGVCDAEAAPFRERIETGKRFGS
jgi:two-component system chemotaxis sensor kinase CheA